MSVIETPRLYFRGHVTWDPVVTNNQAAQYDETDALPVFGSPPTAAAFRSAAIAAVTGGGNWNPHGTHRSNFFETTISGVDLGDGLTVKDPVAKCPVSFKGMLVDLDPYGSVSSQLFFDDMSFGIQGGCQVLAPRTTRMTARYINFARNQTYRYVAGIASVVWQTSFSKSEGLHIASFDSPVLKRFEEALKENDVLGLTVRWNAYRTLYFDSLDPSKNAGLAQQLQAKLQGGGFQPNPARSQLVGVLGLWRKGEPASEPGDRAMLTQAPQQIATAHARLSNDRLTIDLANSIPEKGIDLTKVDLGELDVVAAGPDGEAVVATLGTIPYSAYERSAYEASAGIVTLKLDPAQAEKAKTADLQLRQKDGTVLLAEAALRAIPATPNIYIDEGESSTLAVLVLDRGQPAGAGISVSMADPSSATAAAVAQLTNAEGVATFPLTGNAASVTGFVLVPGQKASIPAGIDTQTTTYAYVRTLPADADIAALDPTWANVYARILINWDAMAPCMDNWLKLGDQSQIRSLAPLLKRLTDKANFESFRFMPVVRDITAGERSLLYRFLDGGGPAIALAEAALRRRPQSSEEMSRKMRRGSI